MQATHRSVPYDRRQGFVALDYDYSNVALMNVEGVPRRERNWRGFDEYDVYIHLEGGDDGHRVSKVSATAPTTGEPYLRGRLMRRGNRVYCGIERHRLGRADAGVIDSADPAGNVTVELIVWRGEARIRRLVAD